MLKKKKRKEKFPPFKCIVRTNENTFFIDVENENEIAELKETCNKNLDDYELDIFKWDGGGAYLLQNEKPPRQIGFMR